MEAASTNPRDDSKRVVVVPSGHVILSIRQPGEISFAVHAGHAARCSVPSVSSNSMLGHGRKFGMIVQR